MSNDSARRTDEEPEIEISEDEDSLVGDRMPKAPAMLRLGRYRVVCELASGGMATVNLAIADGLDKLLALKVIHPHLAQEENFLRMFMDEARIASSISHRNVCNVFDYGEQDGRYYMAMDYLAGTTLRDVIRRIRGKRSKLGPDKLAIYMAYVIAQACEGLHAAHELRDTQGELMEVVHRDVSPHNLFVTYDGNVSVVDFGIARASDRLQQTATGVLKGKFSYMAPEQIRQKSVDRRADIWALGVCLWEALTQKRLFVRATQADTLMSVMTDPIKLPSEVDPVLPSVLDMITLRALSRNPDERFATAREMGRELMAFCRDSGANIGPLEIEHFMEELFPKEVLQSKELVRRAKRAANDDMLEHSQALSLPYLTQSGAQLRPGMRSMSRTLTGATPVSAVGYTGYQGSFPPGEAAPRATTLPAQPGGRSLGFLWGVGFAAALAAAAYFVVPRFQGPAPVAVASDETPLTPHIDPARSAPAGIVAQPRAQEAPALPTPAPQALEDAALPGTDDAREANNNNNTRAATPSGRNYVARNQQRARANHEAAESESESAARSESARPSNEVDASEPRSERPDPAVSAAMEPRPEPIVAPPPVPAAQPSPAAQPVAAAKSAPAKPDNRPLDANAAFANIQTQGSLGSGVVARMLSRAVPLMRTCYQTAARGAGRNDFSSVSLSFTIDEAGLLRNTKAGSHALSGLSSCVSDALKRVRSDQKPDVGVVKVEAQVSFRPL
jgi:serine/threonine-protein kinase